MARRKSSKCPEPLNTMVDIAGAITMGLFARSKIKRDYEKGEGEESAMAARMVFGLGSMRGGSRGLISLGGLIGLNSGLKSINKKQAQAIADEPKFVDRVSDIPKAPAPIRKNLWREHCEDGSKYGINPNNYFSADEYEEALNEAKFKEESMLHPVESVDKIDAVETTTEAIPVWRKHCSDGSVYGINPEDFDNADDYEDAINEAKEKNKNNE